MEIAIPAVTPASVASAAIVTVAVEGITLAGSIREVLLPDMRPGPIIPSNISSRAVLMGTFLRALAADDAMSTTKGVVTLNRARAHASPGSVRSGRRSQKITDEKADEKHPDKS
jgi:hypothetical protein